MYILLMFLKVTASVCLSPNVLGFLILSDPWIFNLNEAIMKVSICLYTRIYICLNFPVDPFIPLTKNIRATTLHCQSCMAITSHAVNDWPIGSHFRICQTRDVTTRTSQLSWLNQGLVYVSSKDVPEQFAFLHLVISQMEWIKFRRRVYMVLLKAARIYCIIEL